MDTGGHNKMNIVTNSENSKGGGLNVEMVD